MSSIVCVENECLKSRSSKEFGVRSFFTVIDCFGTARSVWYRAWPIPTWRRAEIALATIRENCNLNLMVRGNEKKKVWDRGGNLTGRECIFGKPARNHLLLTPPCSHSRLWQTAWPSDAGININNKPGKQTLTFAAFPCQTSIFSHVLRPPKLLFRDWLFELPLWSDIWPCGSVRSGAGKSRPKPTTLRSPGATPPTFRSSHGTSVWYLPSGEVLARSTVLALMKCSGRVSTRKWRKKGRLPLNDSRIMSVRLSIQVEVFHIQSLRLQEGDSPRRNIRIGSTGKARRVLGQFQCGWARNSAENRLP